MQSILGLVIAMAPEAAALMGGSGWRCADSQYLLRSRLKGRTDLIAVRAGIGRENARAAARRLIRLGAGALCSLGLSGGLAPSLRPGDLVLARRCLYAGDGPKEQVVWTPAGGAAVASARRHLTAAGLRVHCADIVSTRRPALGVDCKTALRERFHAMAVDMESAAVASAASEAGLPCLVCRAICDPADRTVPAPFFQALSSDGTLRVPVIASAMLRHPFLLTDLVVLALQACRARKSLRTAWQVLCRSGTATRLAETRPG